MISVNGQRRQDNNFTRRRRRQQFHDDELARHVAVDGRHSGVPRSRQYSAEFGRSSGSNVNIVIKSGTRNLHGSAYEYLRNDKFDANDFFANKQNTGKVPFRQNQYGVAVGGPVVIPKLYQRAGQDFLVLQLGRLPRAPRPNQHQQFPDRGPARRRLLGAYRRRFTIRSRVWPDRTARSSGNRSRATSSRQTASVPAMKFWLDTMIPLPNAARADQ